MSVTTNLLRNARPPWSPVRNTGQSLVERPEHTKYLNWSKMYRRLNLSVPLPTDLLQDKAWKAPIVPGLWLFDIINLIRSFGVGVIMGEQGAVCSSEGVTTTSYVFDVRYAQRVNADHLVSPGIGLRLIEEALITLTTLVGSDGELRPHLLPSKAIMLCPASPWVDGKCPAIFWDNLHPAGKMPGSIGISYFDPTDSNREFLYGLKR